jgi:hypothetical protein
MFLATIARLEPLSQDSLPDQPHVKKIDLDSYNRIIQVLGVVVQDAISHVAEPTPMVSVIFIHVMLAVLREYLAESTRENNRLAPPNPLSSYSPHNHAFRGRGDRHGGWPRS